MCKMYEIIEALCAEKGIKPGKMCTDLGISRGIVGDLKAGRTKKLSAENLGRVASYFGVTTDFLLGYETANGPTPKGEPIQLSGTYLRLAQGAQELGLDDEDVDAILAIYKKHQQKNQ